MIKFFKENMKIIFIVVAVALALILLCCAIVLVGNFRSGLTRQAMDAANHYSEEWQKELNSALQFFAEDAQKIASGVPATEVETIRYFQPYLSGDDNVIRSIYFFDEGQEYSGEGFELDTAESPYVLQMVENGTLAVSGVITDSSTARSSFAVYVPTGAGASVDGLIVYYPVELLKNRLESMTDNADPKPTLLCACSYDGNIFSMLTEDTLGVGEKNSNLFNELSRISNDKTTVNTIVSEIANGRTTSLTVNGDEYAVTVMPASLSGGAMYVVSMYDAYSVYENGHSLASTIGAIIVTVMLIVAAMALYLIVSKLGLTRKMDQYDRTDPIFGCPNYPGFAKDAEEILAQNKATKFAVVYAEVVHFSYITENFGTTVANDTIQYLIKMIDKILTDHEVFGKVNDDHFALLLHYSEFEKLQERLNLLNTFANNCPALRAYNYLLKLNFGLYCVDREKKEDVSLQMMFDRASIASRTAISSQKKEMRIYDDEIHDAFMHEAEIEAKMENALKNGEFKIFYQPKYNIAANKIDGAEALVRWYDAENNRFRIPSEFLPLFEKNGFIAKLDRYVFTEVCKYINEMRNREYRMVPISVNVSRMTATEPDFLDFYLSMKKKYAISDKFIMIEFTESFAYENYEVIREIVSKFHAGGFRCSIDDFGTGFSSYNILKSLPMDEIKLDRFFISPGLSKDRDDKLLSSVITLARAMKMIVTQEGVESVDDLKRLRDMGCDVVQGYIYSKPLPATDFIDFIQSGGSIRIL